MKDYRLRIGMRFVQQGREFIIEGPLPDDQLKIKDTFTDVCSARTMADLLEDLFAGRLELIGAGAEGQVLRNALAQTRVSDLTLLNDGDPLKVEALRDPWQRFLRKWAISISTGTFGSRFPT